MLTNKHIATELQTQATETTPRHLSRCE